MTDTPDDLMGYERMCQDALRGAVRMALQKAVDAPLPHPHLAYVTFRTDYAGVGLHDSLRDKWPQSMTVVFQHQYWNLVLSDDGFTVDMKFNGVPRTMVVPWAAVTRYYDPAVQFLLQFPEPNIVAPVAPEPEVPVGSNVVSLGAFRK